MNQKNAQHGAFYGQLFGFVPKTMQDFGMQFTQQAGMGCHV